MVLLCEACDGDCRLPVSILNIGSQAKNLVGYMSNEDNTLYLKFKIQKTLKLDSPYACKCKVMNYSTFKRYFGNIDEVKSFLETNKNNFILSV